MSSLPLTAYDCFTDDLHPSIVHQWTNPTLQTLPVDLPSPPPPIPDPSPISPAGPHNYSPASSTTTTSPTPLAQPAPSTRTMATCSMRGLYKPKKLFNLSVTIDDPTISPLPKNPN
ncbi:hypothetical protein A2U01_0026113 [Trifolium medium]|uniref:Uncharacterized protein n=1 Tax=Trifolium medium TaxID=97028 RepID=A0A392P028_9FABA|nr:hypothetical protein [Trifolium medium]